MMATTMTATNNDSWSPPRHISDNLSLFVAIIVYLVAVIVVAIIVCGRHCLWSSLVWPSLSTLWPSLFVAVIVCGHYYLWPSLFVAIIVYLVTIIVCGRHCLWPLLFVAIIVCGHHCLWPSLFVAIFAYALYTDMCCVCNCTLYSFIHCLSAMMPPIRFISQCDNLTAPTSS